MRVNNIQWDVSLKTIWGNYTKVTGRRENNEDAKWNCSKSKIGFKIYETNGLGALASVFQSEIISITAAVNGD